MANGYIPNHSYLFIPFSLECTEAFGDFCKSLETGGGWEPVNDEVRYLHRYVSEKLAGGAGSENNACHFRLKEAFAEKQNLLLGTPWYATDPKSFRERSDVTFRFLISGVELFAFNTGIGMLAFELRFENGDPFEIAAAEYYLRKITAERIHFSGGGEAATRESFVDISKRLLHSSSRKLATDFFFYATARNERANFLTYIDVPRKDRYDEELYFLKWCYHDGFDFDGACCDDGSENYFANSNTAWGISTSAAVCLVNRDGKKDFIETVFQKNFRRQYLLTYVLLLHQKYTMYHFLTKLSIGIDGNLAELKKYKYRLYVFETHYMFTLISEVPQYQRFYEKTKKAMALDDMFRDVQEPLSQLSEIQKQDAEDRENRLNTALTTLSLLTVVSALTDATGITANLSWLIPVDISRVIQLCTSGGVLILSILLILRLITLKNKR